METTRSNIENQEKEFISGLVNNVKDNDVRKIIFTKLLVAEKIKQFFHRKGLIINNESPLFSNHQLLKLVDISDIRINEILIDLRIITTSQYPQLWIPKIHKDLDIEPDIYIAVKLSPNLTDLEFLGFIKNNDINTSCTNSKYIITDINKLKPLDEIFYNINQFIKPRIIFMSQEHEKAQELFLPLVEGELNQNNLAFLLKHLLVCEECRKIFKNFCTFDDFFLQMEIDKRDIQDLTLEIFTDNSILQGEEVQINTNEINHQPEIESAIVEPVINTIEENIDNKKKHTLLSKIKKMFIKKPLVPEDLSGNISLQLNNNEISNEEESIAVTDTDEVDQSPVIDSEINDSFEINDTSDTTDVKYSVPQEEVKDTENKDEEDYSDKVFLDIDEDKSKKIDDLIAQFKAMQSTEDSKDENEKKPDEVLESTESIEGERLDLEKAIDELNLSEEANIIKPDNFEFIEVSDEISDEVQAEEKQHQFAESKEDEVKCGGFNLEKDIDELGNLKLLEGFESVQEEEKTEERQESYEETENESIEAIEEVQELSGLEEIILNEPEENNQEESDGLELLEGFESVQEEEKTEEQQESCEETENENIEAIEEVQELSGLEEISLNEPLENNHEESGNSFLDIDEEKSQQINDLIAEFRSLEASIDPKDENQEEQEELAEESKENIEGDSDNVSLSDENQDEVALEGINLNETDDYDSDPLGLNDKSDLLKEAIANMKSEEDKSESINYTSAGQVSSLENTEFNNCDDDENNDSGEQQNNNKGLLDLDEDKAKELDDLIAQFKSLDGGEDEGQDEEKIEDKPEEPKENTDDNSFNLSEENQGLAPLEEVNLNETDDAGSDPLGLNSNSDVLKEAIANMKEENKNEAPANYLSPDKSAVVQNSDLSDFEIDIDKPFEISDSFEIKDSFSLDDTKESEVTEEQSSNNKGLLDIEDDKSKELDDLIAQFKSLDTAGQIQLDKKPEESPNSIDNNQDLTLKEEVDNNTLAGKSAFTYNGIKKLKTKKRYKFIKRYIKSKRAFKKLVALMSNDSNFKAVKEGAIPSIAKGKQQESSAEISTENTGSGIENKVEMHERQTVKLKKKSNGPSIVKIAMFLAAAGALSYVAMNNYPFIIGQFKKDKNLKINENNKNILKKQQNADKKELQTKKQTPVNLFKKENTQSKKQLPAKLVKKQDNKSKSKKAVPVNLIKKQDKTLKTAVKPKKQTKLVKKKNNTTTVKKQKSIDNVLSNAFSRKSSNNSKIKISKVSWEIGASLAKDRSFKNYLVLTGNTLKTYLSDDLLWTNDKASSDKVKLKVKIDLDGNLIKSNILKSSGSKQIDEIILKSLNKTFNYTKLPKINTNKEYINANIVINL